MRQPWKERATFSPSKISIMTWTQLITKLLTLGNTRDQIADTIRSAAEEGLISQEEASARVDLLDRLVNIHNDPVMIIHTETGSIYEVDRKNKRVRRMTGKDNPTPRMGKDGEWRSYTDIQPDPPEAGGRLLIVWSIKATESEEGLVDLSAPTTLTSTIVAINPPLS